MKLDDNDSARFLKTSVLQSQGDLLFSTPLISLWKALVKKHLRKLLVCEGELEITWNWTFMVSLF